MNVTRFCGKTWKQHAKKVKLGRVLICLGVVLWSACGTNAPPQIEFTIVPPKDLGGPRNVSAVAGRVLHARLNSRLVIFAWADGKWWMQPAGKRPYTLIDKNGHWQNTIHLGTQYAAVLSDESYLPPATSASLPPLGGGVLAVVKVAGHGSLPSGGTIQFSRYAWSIRNVFSHRGGIDNDFDPKNVRVDEKGRLHLQITGTPGNWKSAEIKLDQSLGYGTYRFSVAEVTPLEPASVLGIYTWDEDAINLNRREMDIELGRWGEPAAKDVQFIIAPYYVPANVVRFDVPHGPLIYSLRWSYGRAEFAVEQPSLNLRSRILAHYTFTAGVPSSGKEKLYIGLYRYSNRHPLMHPMEVTVADFQYLP
jgi:hypothetical protein